MPHRIRFTYETQTHSLNYNQGAVSWAPALPQSSRLYVIHNADTNFPYYIGTAQNLRNRFNPRAEVSRELGFPAGNALNSVTVYRVQMAWQSHGSLNYSNRTPGNTGTVGLVDAEHLLIRAYLVDVNVNVRNINKVNAFTNNTGRRLRAHFVNNIGGGAAAHIPGFFEIQNNAQY